MCEVVCSPFTDQLGTFCKQGKRDPVNIDTFSKNYFSTVFTYLSRYLKDNDKMIKVFDYVNFRSVEVFR